MVNFILKAQDQNKNIFTYKAETKTECMYEFDRNHFRKGFKFFIATIEDNLTRVESLPRDYPYSVSKLE